MHSDGVNQYFKSNHVETWHLITSILETRQSWCLICRKTESKASWLACWLSLVRADLGSANRLELPVPFSCKIKRKEMHEHSCRGSLINHLMTCNSITGVSSLQLNRSSFWHHAMLATTPSASRGLPSGCCIQPCFPSEGSCIPARDSWWHSSSLWSWPPGCRPGCVGCTTLTSTYPLCPGSCREGLIVFRGHTCSTLKSDIVPNWVISEFQIDAWFRVKGHIMICKAYSLTCLTAAAQRLHIV